MKGENMKKIVILALAMALILPLISCAGNKDKKDGGKYKKLKRKYFL